MSPYDTRTAHQVEIMNEADTDRNRDPTAHDPGSRRRRRAVGGSRCRRTGVALALAWSALAPRASAQTPADTAARDPFELPGLVVTATRVPLDRASLPTPVTVLTRQDLEDRGIRSVAEALRTVPGASVVRAGSPGSQTSLFLRGGESDYVKVLIDGVPVNDPGGAIDLADLSTAQVDRIEVVRGPVSVLYGSDAVAGVVQIFTRRGDGEPRVTVSALGGRGRRRHADEGYGVAEASVSAMGGIGAFSYAGGVSRSWSAGLYPFNDDRELTTASTRLAWAAAPGADLSVTARVTDSRSGFPTDGTGALVDRNARIDRRLVTTALEAGWRLHERVDARIRLGLADRGQETVDAPDGPADTTGVYASGLTRDVTRRFADARIDVELPRSLLTAGLAVEGAVASTAYDSRSEWGPTTASADYDRSTAGYYVQLLARPAAPLRLTGGFRLDDSRTFGTFATYRLGGVLRLGGSTRARGAVGRGFREPTFDESFGSGFGDRGNPDLAPERSASWEAGLEQDVGPATVGATWFHQRFEDLIQFTFAPPGPDDPNYRNVGRARARGLELEAHLQRRRWALDASYTYLDTRVLDPGLATDAGFVEGQRLLRRPAHAGSIAGRLAFPDGSVGLTLGVVGDRADLDFAAGVPAPRITLPAHATLDLAAEHRLPVAGTPRALLRIENLLDAHYQDVAGFPAVGRVVRVGFRLRL